MYDVCQGKYYILNILIFSLRLFKKDMFYINNMHNDDDDDDDDDTYTQ